MNIKQWKIVEPSESDKISLIWISSYDYELEFSKLDTNSDVEVVRIVNKYIQNSLLKWKKSNFIKYLDCLKATANAIRNNDKETLDHSMDNVSIWHPKDPVKMYKIILNHAFPKEDLQKYAPDLIEV